MAFAYPMALFGLLALIPLYLYLQQNLRKQRGVGFPSIAVVRSKGVLRARLFLRVPYFLRLGLLACLIFALARPQILDRSGRRSVEGLDIMLVIDTSNSMYAMDFELQGERRNRLQVVKHVVQNFIDKRQDDRIGLVVFGSEAFTQAPLTMDHQVLQQFLKPISIGMAGPETAIGDALGTAVKRIRDVEAKSKIVILLTDGSNTAGRIDPREASRIAKTLGIKIYTIGVGSNEPVPFPVKSFWGVEYQPQIIKMDVELMESIAKETGGKFFQASDTQALEKVYATIDQLEKTKKEWDQPRGRTEFAWVFLLGGLLFLLLETLWQMSRWRVIP